MRFPSTFLAAIVASVTASACVAPVGKVEVTRFHLPDTAALGRGTIVIEPAPDQNADSMEFQSYAAAVTQELRRLGYSQLVAGGRYSDQIALVSVERATVRTGRDGSPVSVGVGGGAGSYGSGVGVGVGLNLSGPPPELIETWLGVMIRDRVTGQSLWEGRANFSARASSPMAKTQLGAAKLAEALFRDFPGTSGETITVE